MDDIKTIENFCTDLAHNFSFILKKYNFNNKFDIKLCTGSFIKVTDAFESFIDEELQFSIHIAVFHENSQ